ncbi:hypothetical protein BC830DRAFT_344379 [Chytriomyces sp. MP71]|nr:hypothetical protein BC830DRAFT_344379 [Chytriomyces sp. MP71]
MSNDPNLSFIAQDLNVVHDETVGNGGGFAKAEQISQNLNEWDELSSLLELESLLDRAISSSSNSGCNPDLIHMTWSNISSHSHRDVRSKDLVTTVSQRQAIHAAPAIQSHGNPSVPPLENRYIVRVQVPNNDALMQQQQLPTGKFYMGEILINTNVNESTRVRQARTRYLHSIPSFRSV